MITYPHKSTTFTIDDFRIDGANHCAWYYIHVVNDETGVCNRIYDGWNIALVMKKYREFAKECASGWHIEVTVAISQSETRAKLM